MASKIRPARVAVALIEPGDILVTGPGTGDLRTLGTVLAPVQIPGDAARAWRIRAANGISAETEPIPSDGFVWVHLARRSPAS